MKEGRKPEYLQRSPINKLQILPHSEAQKFKPQQRLKCTFIYWWRTPARKAAMIAIA